MLSPLSGTTWSILSGIVCEGVRATEWGRVFFPAEVTAEVAPFVNMAEFVVWFMSKSIGLGADHVGGNAFVGSWLRLCYKQVQQCHI